MFEEYVLISMGGTQGRREKIIDWTTKTFVRG